ncbi:MAG: DUF1501 domain-containing protein [Planctomycetes bacterium]|nr:DUF1501 domain-containing protein [Planctomycetota bacterium]
MLEITGSGSGRFCDGVNRRSFLQIGALGIGGLTLADLLRAEAAGGKGSSHKAVINIHLSGGPSHQDIFDLKPEAPTEYRGEFMPIHTNVPGLDICEKLPRLATMGDKFAVIRSLVGSNAGHSNFQTQSGFNQRSLAALGGRPALGSVISKLRGSLDGAPPFVSYSGGSPGYLGPTHQPFSPRGSGAAMKNLRLEGSLTMDRLGERSSLLKSLDRLRRDVDASGQMKALDKFTETAIDVITSGRVANALDLKREDPKLVARYGRAGSTLLTARRLIEAGVRVVTMNSFGGFDTHSNNFKTLGSRNLPGMDQALSALLSDLDNRGMLDDVSVVMWGEFGRTPRVNKRAGRDHWPRLAMAFMAGGGIRGGQAVGSSNRLGEVAKTRPVHYQEVHATLYHNLGVDLRTTQFIDPAGRPQYILEKLDPIKELV